MNRWLGISALLWAGTVLGGSLIAAPAKFQVEALRLPVALQVGRVQFLWVTIAEVVFLVVSLTLLAVAWRREAKVGKAGSLLLFAVAVFALQHLGLMPPLQARSERIIAGESVGESSLHLVYVAAECIKVFVLVTAGCWPVSTTKSPSH